MDIEKLNEAIGKIDASIVEAALSDGSNAKATVIVKRPWLKWVAAAVAIVVFAVGTPLALNMMGAFRSDNIVAPGGSGSDNSAIITPIDSSEPDSSGSDSGSEQSSVESEPGSSERDNRQHNASPRHGGEIDSAESGGESSSESSAGQTVPEKPLDPEPPQNEDPPEPAEGEFIKDDMPAVTYKINGEDKTFVYQSSTRIRKADGEEIDGNSGNYVVDHYIADDGATVSKNEASADFVRYEKAAFFIDTAPDERISAEDAIEIARSAVMNTDLPIGSPDSFNATVRYSMNSYLITFKTAEGSVEVHLDKNGELQFMSVKKDALQHLSSEKVSAAIAKMNAKLAELNNDTNGMYVLDRMHFEEWGSSVYAVFDVLHYSDKSTDEYDVYQYYCAV